MSFRFFRPWEDGGMASRHQTPVRHQIALTYNPGERQVQQFDDDANLPTEALSPSQKASKIQKLVSGTAMSPHRINDSDAQINDVMVQNPKYASRSAVDISSPSKDPDRHGDNTEGEIVDNCEVISKSSCLTSLHDTESTKSYLNLSLRENLLSEHTVKSIPTDEVQCTQDLHLSCELRGTGGASPRPCHSTFYMTRGVKRNIVIMEQRNSLEATDTATTTDNPPHPKRSALEMLHQTHTFSSLPVEDCNSSDTKSLQSKQCETASSSTNGLKLPESRGAPTVAAYSHNHNNNSDETKTQKQDESLGQREPSPICNTCGKHFCDSFHLTKNMASYARPRPFQCSVCNKTFSRSANLYKHERIHSGSRPFKCNIRTKNISQSSSLQIHERIHTGFKPYKCQICNKSFSKGSHLRRHERTHAGSKPFKCEFCPQTFSRQDNAREHERIHTGSKPFKCKFCMKAFSHSSNLRVHERTHTGSKPFKCKFCTKAFCQSNKLRLHECTHTGFKPFSCKFCTKTFSHSSDLLRHEWTHTGLKPYKCLSCNKAFSRRDRLRTHEQIHT